MRQEIMSFDTYAQFKNFEKAGFEAAQAEVIVNAINSSREFDLSRLATREQLVHLEEKLTAKIDGVEEKLAAQMGGLEEKFTAQMGGLEEKFTAQMGGLEQKLKTESAILLAAIKDSTITTLRWTFVFILGLCGVIASVIEFFTH